MERSPKGADGGPSVCGRGMVLALVLFPIAFVVTALLNAGLVLLPLRCRLGIFLLGLVVPAIMLAISCGYLRRVGPYQHESIRRPGSHTATDA